MSRLFPRLAAAVTVLIAVGIAPATVAGADPVSSGHAKAYGVNINVSGQGAVANTPTAETGFTGDVKETLVDVPADPIAVSGTLVARANSHAQSDLPSMLKQSAQTAMGPYNTRAVGTVEELDLLLDAVADDVSLLHATAVRAEAVAVCSAGGVSYSANSEIVDLQIGGQDVPLNTPLQDLIDTIDGIIDDAGLTDVVDIGRNVVTTSANGIAVDALTVKVLSAAGTPVADVTIGHAEVSGASCADNALPECSDHVDNADPEDTLVDIHDPGCHTDGKADNPDTYDPDDDDEGNLVECNDNVDNADAEDTLADEADPGCHTDHNANNADSYRPYDDDESDNLEVGRDLPLPKTGGLPFSGVVMFGTVGLAGIAWSLRRRVNQ